MVGCTQYIYTTILLQLIPLLLADPAPVNIAANDAFIQCLERGECGLENKCAFKLHSGSDSDFGGTTVSGHIIAIKNRMSYPIVFFWDLLGYDGLSDPDGTERFKGVYVLPNSITYIDTKYYGSHTIRLYVPIHTNDPGLLQSPPPPGELESIQTLMASKDQCTKNQACMLLNGVCYMASSDDKDCPKYRSVCGGFNDADDIAKFACFPECAYTWWSEELKDLFERITPEDIDSEAIVDFLLKGGGIKGSNVNGLCNTSLVTGLTFGLVISLLANAILLFLAWKWKRSINSANRGDVYEDEGEGGIMGFFGFPSMNSYT